MKNPRFARMAVLGLALGLGAAFVATLTVPKSAATQPERDHGLPHPTLLARGTFLDRVAAQIRVKPEDGAPTRVLNVSDASDVVMLQILLEPGVAVPWHTHWGPNLTINAGPGTLQYVSADDCAIREVPPGSAIVDPGGGHVHTARNGSDEDIVLYVTFLAVPPGQGPVVPAAPPADCDPF